MIEKGSRIRNSQPNSQSQVEKKNSQFLPQRKISHQDNDDFITQLKEEIFQFSRQYKQEKQPQGKILDIAKKILELKDEELLKNNFQFFRTSVQFISVADNIPKASKHTTEFKKKVYKNIQQVLQKFLNIIQQDKNNLDEETKENVLLKIKNSKWKNRNFLILTQYHRFLTIQTQTNQQNILKLLGDKNQFFSLFQIDIQYIDKLFDIISLIFRKVLTNNLPNVQKILIQFIQNFLEKRKNKFLNKFLQVLTKQSDKEVDGQINIQFIETYLQIMVNVWKKNEDKKQPHNLLSWLFNGKTNQIKEHIITKIQSYFKPHLQDQIWKLNLVNKHKFLTTIYTQKLITEIHRNPRPQKKDFNQVLHIVLSNKNFDNEKFNLKQFEKYFKQNSGKIEHQKIADIYTSENQELKKKLLLTFYSEIRSEKKASLSDKDYEDFEKYFLIPFQKIKKNSPQKQLLYALNVIQLFHSNQFLKDQIKQIFIQWNYKYLLPYYQSKKDILSNEIFLAIILIESILEEQKCSDVLNYFQKDVYNYANSGQDDGEKLLKIFEDFPSKTSLAILLNYLFYVGIIKKCDPKIINHILKIIGQILDTRYFNYQLFCSQTFKQALYINNLPYYNHQVYAADQIDKIITQFINFIGESDFNCFMETAKSQEHSQFLQNRIKILDQLKLDNSFMTFQRRLFKFTKLFQNIIEKVKDIAQEKISSLPSNNFLRITYRKFQDNCFFYLVNEIPIINIPFAGLKRNANQSYQLKMLINRKKQFRIRVESKNMVYEIDINKLDQIIRIQNNQKKEIISRQNETKDIDSDLNIKITTNKDNFELSLNTNVYKLQIPQKQAYNIVIQTTDSFIVSDLHYKQVGKQVTIPLNQALTIHTNSQVNSQLTIKINDVKQIVMGKMKSQFDYKYLFVLFHQILRHMKLSQDERQSVNQLLLCRDSQRNSEKDRIAEIIVKLILSRSDPHNEHKDLVSEIQKIARGLNKNGKEEWDNFVSKLEKEGELFYQEKLLKNPVLKLRNIQLPDYTRPITRFIQKPQHIEQPHKSFDEGQINKSIDDKKKSQSQPIEKGVFSHKCQLIKRKGGYFGHIIVTQQRYIKIVCNNDQRPNQVPFIYGIPQDYLIKDKKKVKKIHLDQIEEIISKKFNQIANNSIEIYLKNGKSYFITLYEETTVKSFYIELEKLAVSKDILVSNPYQTFKKKKYTQYWQNNDLSNFQYLMLINKYSGRSYNDLSQPYVFPWVIENYKSDKFQRNPQNLRDLSKPLPFLNKQNKNSIISQYQNYLSFQSNNFFFNLNFFSSKASISKFLIKFQPYTQLIQNEDDEYKFITKYQNHQNNQELIPQFYYLPQILNNNGLPTWADQDHNKFISIMRQTLQSQLISEKLPKWIDSTFGCKRYEALNVKEIKNLKHSKDIYSLLQETSFQIYKSTCYNENVDHENLRQEDVRQIYRSGQFPIELFRKLHPQKLKTNILNSIIEQRIFQFERDQCITQMLSVNRNVFFKVEKGGKTTILSLDMGPFKKLNKVTDFQESYKELKILKRRQQELYLITKKLKVQNGEISQTQESCIFLQKFNINFSYKKVVAGTRFLGFCGKVLRILDYYGQLFYSWNSQEVIDCAFGKKKFYFITRSGIVYSCNYVEKQHKKQKLNLAKTEHQHEKLDLKFLFHQYETKQIVILVINKQKILVENNEVNKYDILK